MKVNHSIKNVRYCLRYVSKLLKVKGGRKLTGIITLLILLSAKTYSQGFWLPVTMSSPDYNNGVMLLLSDGSVMVKCSHGGVDTIGNLWDKLMPNGNGSYLNGSWDTITQMNYRRLYCSSQVLTDGRVYVAGGEYGTGAANGEIYNPLANSWGMTGPLPAGYRISDGNSEMLPGGKVLQGIVSGGSRANCIFDPVTNHYTLGPSSLGNHDESAWVKLPDSSILFVDVDTRKSERYIPSLNTWIADDSLPVSLYDTFDYETGAAFLLPDGRVFFIGSPGTSAYYTPSGNTSPGSWATGPAIPDSLGAPDAAAAMMPNGKILCAFSHVPDSVLDYPTPTQFYEFNYLTNSFTHISSPTGGDTLKGPSYITNMLDLPDGNILFSSIGSNKYYVYMPDGVPLTEGKPIIDRIVKVSCDTYKITGNLFNGISEGAAYGDDWQMSTNYPLVRLVSPNSLSGDQVFYARTFNWNRTGAMTGSLPDTVTFTLPSSLPEEGYVFQVVTNGISSDPYSYSPCIETGITQLPPAGNNKIFVYPNPATDQVRVVFHTTTPGNYKVKLIDIFGRVVFQENDVARAGENSYLLSLHGIPQGVYNVLVAEKGDYSGSTLVVE